MFWFFLPSDSSMQLFYRSVCLPPPPTHCNLCIRRNGYCSREIYWQSLKVSRSVIAEPPRARSARTSVELHTLENLVNYLSQKIWLRRYRTSVRTLRVEVSRNEFLPSSVESFVPYFFKRCRMVRCQVLVIRGDIGQSASGVQIEHFVLLARVTGRSCSKAD